MSRAAQEAGAEQASSEAQPAPQPGAAPRSWRRNDWLLLACILLVGLCLRASYLRELVGQPDFDAPIDDMQFHDYWARGVVTGDWTPPEGRPQQHIPDVPYLKSPGYPFFLIALYFLTGTNYLAVRIIQMALGLLNVVLGFVLGRSLFGRKAGLIAAFLMATYWVFIFFEGELHAPVLAVFLALLLALALRPWTSRITFLRALGAGVLLGVFALVRTNALLYAPVILAWAWWLLWRRGKGRRIVVVAPVFVAGVAIIIGPVTIRNYVVSGELVPVTSNVGFTFYFGNNESANAVAPLAEYAQELEGHGMWNPFVYPNVTKGLAKELGKEDLTNAQASKYLMQKGIEYIKQHPRRILKLVLMKMYLFWSPEEIDSNKVVAYEKRNSPTLRYMPGFAVVFTLFIAGVLLLFSDSVARWKRGTVTPHEREAMAVAVLIILLIATYYGSFLPFFVNGRFRVTIIPYLLLFGAYGVYRMGQFLRAQEFRRAAFWGGLGAGLYVLSSFQFIHFDPNALRWHDQRARAYEAKQDLDSAVAEYEAALDFLSDLHGTKARLYQLARGGSSDAPYVHNRLGCLLIKQGKFDEAIEQFVQALRADPNHRYADYNWARALALQGKLQEASVRFRQAVRKNPDYVDARINLGVTLFRMGKYEEALGEYEEAIRTSPKSARAHGKRGEVLGVLDRYDEAAAECRRALELDPQYAPAYDYLAVALAGLGEFQRAVEQYEKGLQMRPADGGEPQTLGVLLEEMGKTGLAAKLNKLRD